MKQSRIKKIMNFFLVAGQLPVFLLFLAGCGSDIRGGGSEGATEVTINMGSPEAVRGITTSPRTSSVPSTVQSIKVKVSASDMSTVEKTVTVVSGQESVQVSIIITNGSGRQFEVFAYDSSSALKYYGYDSSDLLGTPLTLAVRLYPAESAVGNFPALTPDETDTQALAIIQTIPPNASVNIDPNTSITIFFDDQINPATINDAAIVVRSAGSSQMFGRYSGILIQAGNMVMTFQPYFNFLENDTITVTLLRANGIEDDRGNTLAADYTFSFQTQQELASPADSGFEQGAAGWSFSGDGAIVSCPMDDVPCTQGSYMAGISTGSVFGSTALNDTTTILTSGPMPVPAGQNSLSFYYDFISEEFDEFVGSVYDDVFTVTVAGPSGSYSDTVTSVNIVGAPASLPLSFYGLNFPDHTTWTKETVSISSLGSPVTITFSVSDVGDTAYTSAVVIDSITFE